MAADISLDGVKGLILIVTGLTGATTFIPPHLAAAVELILLDRQSETTAIIIQVTLDCNLCRPERRRERAYRRRPVEDNEEVILLFGVADESEQLSCWNSQQRTRRKGERSKANVTNVFDTKRVVKKMCDLLQECERS